MCMNISRADPNALKLRSLYRCHGNRRPNQYSNALWLFFNIYMHFPKNPK